MADYKDSLDMYRYLTPSGVIVPDTLSVKETVETAYRQAFGLGDDLDITSETILGRLIEKDVVAITQTLGVVAQNANQFNPHAATGAYLDHLIGMFGGERIPDETDEHLRKRILATVWGGAGFAKSIETKVSGLSGVRSCVVLENNGLMPKVVGGVTIPGHSVFVCVDRTGDGDATDEAIANAIHESRSAGCGYKTDTLDGNRPTKVTLTSGHSVYFYDAVVAEIDISVSVDSRGYSGDDVAGDIRTAVDEWTDGLEMGHDVTEFEVASVIASAIPSLRVKSVQFGSADAVHPYRKLSVGALSVDEGV